MRRCSCIARDELRELAEALDGVDGVLRPNDPYPPFDFYSNLLSLPRVFLTGANAVPADVPYLPIDAERATAWAARFAGEPGSRWAWCGPVRRRTRATASARCR